MSDRAAAVAARSSRSGYHLADSWIVGSTPVSSRYTTYVTREVDRDGYTGRTVQRSGMRYHPHLHPDPSARLPGSALQLVHWRRLAHRRVEHATLWSGSFGHPGAALR